MQSISEADLSFDSSASSFAHTGLPIAADMQK